MNLSLQLIGPSLVSLDERLDDLRLRANPNVESYRPHFDHPSQGNRLACAPAEALALLAMSHLHTFTRNPRSRAENPREKLWQDSCIPEP